jgi:hypothetical protein
MLRTAILLAASALLAAACNDAIPAGADGACSSCAEVYTQGGTVCGDTPSGDAWQALTECACSGACASACGASFCTTSPADDTCGPCLMSACPALVMSCSMN